MTEETTTTTVSTSKKTFTKATKSVDELPEEKAILSHMLTGVILHSDLSTLYHKLGATALYKKNFWQSLEELKQFNTLRGKLSEKVCGVVDGKTGHIDVFESTKTFLNENPSIKAVICELLRIQLEWEESTKVLYETLVTKNPTDKYWKCLVKGIEKEISCIEKMRKQYN